MKKCLVVLMTLAFLAPSAFALADGCYMCKDKAGGYVQYKGEDTFAKRKEAQDKFKCDVGGTVGTCQDSKTRGEVSDKK